jgi:hypothetical protein
LGQELVEEHAAPDWLQNAAPADCTLVSPQKPPLALTARHEVVQY